MNLRSRFRLKNIGWLLLATAIYLPWLPGRHPTPGGHISKIEPLRNLISPSAIAAGGRLPRGEKRKQEASVSATSTTSPDIKAQTKSLDGRNPEQGGSPASSTIALPPTPQRKARNAPIRKEARRNHITNTNIKSPTNSSPILSCLSDFASRLAAPGFFSENGDQYYHFSRVRVLRKKKPTARKWYRYNVHKIDIKMRRAFVVATINSPTVDAVVGHGDPAKGATIITWNPQGVLCSYGRADFMTLGFNSKSQIRSPSSQTRNKGDQNGSRSRIVRDKGEVTIIGKPGGHLLYNLKRRAILELDFQTFQTRNSPALTPNFEQPIFVIQSKRIQYTWRRASGLKGSRRGLIHYKNIDHVEAQLEFMNKDKLIFDENSFGVAQFNGKTNSIKIKEVSPWSSNAGNHDYSISLPPAHPVSSASLQPVFASHKVFVLGMSEASKKRWRRGYLFDYRKGWEIGKFKPKRGNYVSHGQISADGKRAIIMISAIKTGLLRQIKVFSFESRKWLKVKIAKIR